MSTEIQSLINTLQDVQDGEPWFGRSVYTIVEEIDPEITAIKPAPAGHSLLDLLYHMLTWADFTLKRIEKDKVIDLVAFEKSDWRDIDPAVHTWERGVAAFKSTHGKIIRLLQTKDDAFLEEAVDFRKYNFRFLIQGLIQHNIYHLGQIAYIKKLLA